MLVNNLSNILDPISAEIIASEHLAEDGVNALMKVYLVDDNLKTLDVECFVQRTSYRCQQSFSCNSTSSRKIHLYLTTYTYNTAILMLFFKVVRFIKFLFKIKDLLLANREIQQRDRR